MGMRFDGTPLKDVLDTIGKAAGLKMRPWKDEGSFGVRPGPTLVPRSRATAPQARSLKC